MKRTLARGVGVAAAFMAFVGSGSAAANNEYVGQTYAKAAASIKGSGGTPVIVSRIGEYLPTEQCEVTGSRRGQAGGKSAVLLNLNCNDTLNGHPGNSATSPEGQKVVAMRAQADQLSKDYASGSEYYVPYCAESADATKTCADICAKAKTCSAELNHFLGL